jgi:hypothetical protein
MIAEYAHAYGGPPAPDMAWPLFVALAERAPRFTARAKLVTFDAVRLAIGAAFADRDGGYTIDAARDEMIEQAYAVERERQIWTTNGNGSAGDPADG